MISLEYPPLYIVCGAIGASHPVLQHSTDSQGAGLTAVEGYPASVASGTDRGRRQPLHQASSTLKMGDQQGDTIMSALQ